MQSELAESPIEAAPGTQEDPAPSPARAWAHRALHFLLGTLMVAAPASLVDAGWTALSAPKRPFTWALPFQAFLAHAALSFLLASVAAALLRFGRPARRRTPLATGAALAVSAYVVVFGGHLSFADELAASRDLGELIAPGSLVVIAGLLALAAVMFLLVGHVLDSLRPRGWRPVRALALMFSAVLLAGGVVSSLRIAGPAARSYAGASEIPAAAANVLWIVLDTTRRDRTSLHDPALGTTPNLARLAAEGASFDAASAPASFTLTSHASMLTGLPPGRHGANLNHQRLAHAERSIAVELARSGRRTAAFVANRVLRLETGLDAGFELYDDLVDPEVCCTALWDLVHDVQAFLALKLAAFRNDGQPHWIQDGQRSAAAQNRRIVAWLDEHAQRPFFLFVNYYDPHWPYSPEEPWRSRFADDYAGSVTGHLFRDDDLPPGYALTQADRRHLLALYDAELAYLDHHLGLLLEHLERFGQLDRTLLVITSDHGEQFGERGLYGHFQLYEPSLAVPLVLRLPGPIPAGLRIEDPVQTTDLCGTVLDLAVGRAPEDRERRSLVRYLRSGVGDAQIVVAEDLDGHGYALRMARLGPLKLIEGFGGRLGQAELYDLASDPLESSNLLAFEAPALSQERAALLTELKEAIDGLSTPQGGGAPSQPDATSRRVLRALGYVD